MLQAKESGNRNNFPEMEPGLYLAICYSIVDIGEQENKMYNNTSRQIVMTWEFPDERVEVNGQMLPRAQSMFFTLSLNERARLRGFLENWRGRAFTAEELAGFDVGKVLGAPCMLNMVERVRPDGSKHTVIGGVSRVPKGMTVPLPENPLVLFDLDAPDAITRMQELPEWIQNKIREGVTYQQMTNPRTGAPAENGEAYTEDDFDESGDLPF